jgi:hypothetical protein
MGAGSEVESRRRRVEAAQRIEIHAR